ncbi:MAG: aldehyde dehydrogenase family protein [Phycicoccus sp.]|nr:aldehyde dehydrogenase family protein [Phycicoccus sp.]
MRGARETVSTQLYIGGECRSTSGRLSITDPAMPATVVGTAAAATERDVTDAVTAGVAAFAAWSALSVRERAHRLAAAVRSDVDDLAMDARILTRENGKVLAESERDVSMLQRRTMAMLSLAEDVESSRTLAATPEIPATTWIGHQPLGLVTIIVPFNWPIGILSNALPYALLAGNTVIVKPPPSAPLATTRIATRMAQALPPGVLNVVTGPDEAMTDLIQGPQIAKVCFTGSVSGGSRIMAAAARSLTRVTLELGGNDAALILDDAPLDRAHLDRLFSAVFSSSGQVCMNAKRIYVHRSRMSEVVEGLSERLERVVLGHGLAPETTMGPLHTSRQRDFVADLIADAASRGAQVQAFGDLPSAPAMREGYFLRPTLVIDPPIDATVVTEEPFGPVVPIVGVDNAEQAVALANDNWAGLSGSVWSTDLDRARQVAQQLVCGYVWINDHGAPRLDLRAPFGGMKQSGMGREQGIEGIRSFQDTRAISITAPAN